MTSFMNALKVGLPVIFCCLLISSRGCSAAEATWGGEAGLTMQVTWPEGGDWVSNLSSSEPGETEPPEASEPPLAWSLSLACCSASWCRNTKIFGILFCHKFFFSYNFDTQLLLENWLHGKTVSQSYCYMGEMLFV